MAVTYDKPLPKIDECSRPWWEAARRHRLQVQRCQRCGHLAFPPAPMCPSCRSTELGWMDVSGRGKVWSFTIFHKCYFPSFANEMPYAVAIVKLEEGPRMWTQVVGIPIQELRIGLPVEAVFEDVTDEVTLVKFRPVVC
jgi:uncharacterized OB-fold protein